ncbi:hypothetical protein CTM55_00275 [Prevotella intermedia]|nr:hypothetical protein CTM55_00275 [Prevotella intermedia]
MQNLLFYIPKAAVLHGKSVGFASQNSRFRNVKTQLSLFKRIIFYKTNAKSSYYDTDKVGSKRNGIAHLKATPATVFMI